MSEPAPKKWPCTFKNCDLVFDSLEDMIYHKKKEPLHDYCVRCKEDFEDCEYLLIHKIKSDKHIVCPVCGTEFGSEGGRDLHIRTFHRSKQELKCFGCKETFGSASGLMRHVEDNDCPIISPQRVLQEQSKKLLIREALEAGDVSMTLTASSEIGETSGGVRLEIEASGREALMNQPFAKSAVSAKLARKHWPTIGGGSSASSDLIDMSDQELNNDKGKQVWQSAGSQVGSIAENVHPFGVGIPEPGQTIRAFHRTWDPTKFFNSFSGEYVCPCGSGFGDMKEFEQHVLQKSQMMHRVQCPCCQKMFKSISALVAHCESGSSRCDIAHTEKYGQMIDELTGGIIQTAGYNPDGTIKYAAGELELENTTTVGRDLTKVQW